MMYYQLLKESQYMKLLIAGVINRLGDAIDAIALTWLVYQVSQDPAITALQFGMNYLPTVFIQPLAGAYIEKLNHQKIMVTMDFIRGLIILILSLCVFFDRVNVLMILSSTFLLSTAEAFRLPANTALIPQILCRDLYSYGQSLQISLFRLSEIIGTGIAGIIIGIWGLHMAMILDTLSFLISGTVISLIRYQQREQSCEKTALLENFQKGFSYLKKHRRIYKLCLLGLILNALLVPLNSLQSVLCGDFYHMGASALSLMNLSVTCGCILGAFVYPYVQHYVSERFWIMLSFVMIAVFYFGSVAHQVLLKQEILFSLTLIFLNFMMGMVISYLSTYSSVHLLEDVHENYLARVMAISSSISTMAIPITSTMISVASLFLDVNTLFCIVGVLSMCLGLIYNIFK